MKNINIKKGIKRVLAGTIVLTSLSANALAYQYVIKRGDTLRKISKNAYGTPSYSTELANYNNIPNPNFIREGEVIEIPNINTIKDYKHFVFIENEPKQNEFYRVKKGDTLGKICKQHYGSYKYIDKLAAYNGIANIDAISIGQIIKLPSTYELEKLVGFTYKVKKGDTLEKIAIAYYGKKAFAQLLAEYNCLETNTLYEGQLIFVPSYSQMLEFCNAIHNVGKGKTNVKTRNI